MSIPGRLTSIYKTCHNFVGNLHQAADVVAGLQTRLGNATIGGAGNECKGWERSAQELIKEIRKLLAIIQTFRG